MTISVIIPTFNEEQGLPSTLASLSSLMFDEVIVVDGKSQDRTIQVAERGLQQFPHAEKTVISSPAGRALQMNAGASQSNAEVFVFLHADTLLPSNARTTIEQAMADPSTVGGRFDVQFQTDHGYAWVISRMMNWRSRWSGIATGDQAIFVRRAIFQQLSGFADIPIMEDIELTTRLKRLGRLAALPCKVTTSFRRWDQHGLLRTILRMWILRFLYWCGMNPRTLQHFYEPVR